MRIRAYIRFASILIGSTLLLSACLKRKSTQGAAKPLESFTTIYSDQYNFDETSRDTLRSSLGDDESDDGVSDTQDEVSRPRSKRVIRSQLHEHQAHCVDIPVPLQATLLECYFDAQKGMVMFEYDARGYVSDYMLFYEQGLERSGWRAVAVSATPFETLLIFDKPERFCVVSLRHAHSDGSVPIRIMIHTGIKEEVA